MNIAWSTAKKRLWEQGVSFSEVNGYALNYPDWLANTIRIYPSDGKLGADCTLWQAYTRVRDALVSGSRLSNDEVTIAVYYALQQMFKGLDKVL